MLFLIFVYTIILFLPFIINKKGDIFCPDKMYCLLYTFTTVPFLFFSHFNKELILSQLYFLKNSLDAIVGQFLILQSLGTIVFYVSYYSKKNISPGLLRLCRKIIFHADTSHKKVWACYLLSMFFSISLFIHFLFSKGGITQIIAGFTNRHELLQDAHFNFLLLSFFTFIASIYLIRLLQYNKTKLYHLFILLNYVYFFFALSIAGGRSPFIILLLQTFIAYNVYIKKINLFSIRYLPIYLFIIVFIVIMPQLRYTDFAESNKKNVFGDNIENLISGNSYVNIQLYIIDHFNTENIWYGRSYIDLFYAWLPRSVFTDKPPVDDGMYIVNHYYGYFFQPSTPIRLMIQTSWPPGTMGIGYINFHFIGIILAYFILGRLMKMGYLIFTKMRYSPLILFFYLFLVVKFQLTNFYIFYTISYVFLLIVLSIMIKLFIKMRQKL